MTRDAPRPVWRGASRRWRAPYSCGSYISYGGYYSRPGLGVLSKLEQFVEGLAQVVDALAAGEADGRGLAVLKKQQGGQRHHAVVGGKVVFLVAVLLADFDAAGIFLGQLVDDGRHCAAGAAQGCPEVHHHGLAGGDDFLDVRVVEFLCHFEYVFEFVYMSL